MLVAVNDHTRHEQWEKRLSDRIPVSTTLLIEPPRIFTTKPELLQTHGAGEGPAWHPQWGERKGHSQ